MLLTATDRVHGRQFSTENPLHGINHIPVACTGAEETNACSVPRPAGNPEASHLTIRSWSTTRIVSRVFRVSRTSLRGPVGVFNIAVT